MNVLVGRMNLKEAPVERLEAAILRTLLYADVFSFPMTADEIHHFLIHDTPVSREQVVCALQSSEQLADLLETAHGYYVCAGRADMIAVRIAREQASERLMPQAIACGAWLARLPFVRMVALTGALAMRNASAEDDDLDYLLVTTPRRVWLARAFSILLVRLARRRGVEICPNYVLADTALAQDQHDLFIAHEVTQITPVAGQDLYERLRAANPWVSSYLPNSGTPFYEVDEPTLSPFWRALQRALEIALGGWFGDRLERWEQQRKLRRFAADLQTPHSAARLDDEHVKGHFQDHGHRVLREYQQRLDAYGLAEAALEANGKTIAVLPAAVDEIYPRSHVYLAREILQKGGALISEYPTGTEPLRHNFIARNRIVSGLSDAVLVTEAAEKSGTLHTANFALEQGRTVMAVPGDITNELSKGTNNLIKAGAVPVTSAKDIFEALKIEVLESPSEVVAASEEEAVLLKLLSQGISEASELQLRSELPATLFNQTLTMLEITGKAKPLGAGHWRIT